MKLAEEVKARKSAEERLQRERIELQREREKQQEEFQKEREKERQEREEAMAKIMREKEELEQLLEQVNTIKFVQQLVFTYRLASINT